MCVIALRLKTKLQYWLFLMIIVSVKNLSLRLLLIILTATDNVSQNVLLEYIMMNSIFESTMQVSWIRHLFCREFNVDRVGGVYLLRFYPDLLWETNTDMTQLSSSRYLSITESTRWVLCKAVQWNTHWLLTIGSWLWAFRMSCYRSASVPSGPQYWNVLDS